jgi:hypothetical protein
VHPGACGLHAKSKVGNREKKICLFEKGVGIHDMVGKYGMEWEKVLVVSEIVRMFVVWHEKKLT